MSKIIGRFSIKYFMAIAVIIANVSIANANEVNLYSAQKEHLIRPILDKFEEQTGIEVNMITGGKSELVARIENEGKNTPADVLLTVDIGNVYEAKEKGLLQSVDSEILTNNIPEYLRGEDNSWFGFTLRFRAIFYNKDKVNPEMISGYEDLADAKWNKSLLIRSSSNVYNQSLVASIVAHSGKEKAKQWVDGVVENFAREPQGGDSIQIRSLAAGEGSIAVANSYYYGRLVAGGDDIKNELVKEKVGIILPNQKDRGAHVNIRGGGVTKHAKNKENAIKLLEFLSGDEAQEFFANVNYEYPVKKGVKIPDVLQAWGELKHDTINLEKIAEQQKTAIYLMDEAGWK